MRLFAALVPPLHAVEHLDAFLEPRRDADPDLRWSQPHQWHVTCAFAADAPDYLLDDLSERLAVAASHRQLPPLHISGGGAFPHPDRARVLWAGSPAAHSSDTSRAADELAALSRGCRTAFTTAGVPVDGQRFHPHLTLARLRRPANVTRWLRVLQSYQGPVWNPHEITLIASHLGEGPRRAPRYEVLATMPLADTPLGAGPDHPGPGATDHGTT